MINALTTTETKKILLDSDNGAAPGPSGWGGNMLSILASDDTCVEAMSLLITNIINGDIPNQVKHLFTSSRLVVLGKKNGGGVRPVAIGELFYRIAAAHAFRVVREYMAELLSPHQYGIGISNGCEKIIHNISHSLSHHCEQRFLSRGKVDMS